MIPTIWRRALIAIAGLAAVAASFVFLTDLAVHVGWPDEIAWLLPLCIDALGAAALTRYHFNGDRSALLVAVLAILASTTGNALSHLYSTGILIPDPVVIIAAGAVPPVTLGLIVHLTIRKAPAWDLHVASPGSSLGVSGPATDTPNPPKPRAANTTGGARGAGRSGNGGSDGIPRFTPRPEHVQTIVSNGWQNRTGQELARELRTAKPKALAARRAARELSTVPSSPNGKEPVT